MTRRGGTEASVSSRGIGDDERQSVMARLAARWRRLPIVPFTSISQGHLEGNVFLYHQAIAGPRTIISPGERRG